MCSLTGQGNVFVDPLDSVQTDIDVKFILVMTLCTRLKTNIHFWMCAQLHCIRFTEAGSNNCLIELQKLDYSYSLRLCKSMRGSRSMYVVALWRLASAFDLRLVVCWAAFPFFLCAPMQSQLRGLL